jgi:hypothetical protein
VKKHPVAFAFLIICSIACLGFAGQPADGEAPVAQASPIDAGPESTCWAAATCSGGGSVSCSGSATCSSVDASCPSQRGYVTCDGVTTYCPICRLLNCTKDGDLCVSTSDCRPPQEDCEFCYCDNGIELPKGICKCNLPPV